MSLKRNILANYVSQIYVTLIGIIMVPVYIRYMGAEAYGLVGFFAMLQAWFALLDIGLTPTVARETARFHGGASTALNYRRLVRAMEGVFLAVALVGGAVLLASSGYIAHQWLQASMLPHAEVQAALQLMAIIIAMRWICGLYRGIISGAEKLVWLSWFNSLIATVRFVGVLPLLMLVSGMPTLFFGFQLAIAVVELLGLMVYANRSLPVIPQNTKPGWDWKPLQPVLKFSLTIAFTSSVWVLVTQTDKLILSKILPLAQYGYFTLAIVVASAVTLINGPVSAAILPRMSKLEAEGDHAGLIHIYRSATQLVAIFAASASATVTFFAESLLWGWTGDRTLANHSAQILILYAIGNGILAVAAFPYYLQYAKGDLRLHLMGNAIFALLLIPTITWAATHFGAVGAGYVWLGLNLLSFVVWLPFVHRKFEPGLNLKWYFEDVTIIYLITFIGGFCLALLLPHQNSRLGEIGMTMGFGLAMLLLAAGSSTMARAAFKKAGWSHPDLHRGNE